MTMTDGSAQCCRLPADCVRPFDGFIRKAIDRNSWEVAKRIAEEVKKSVDFTNGTVKIPVAIEANSFNFTASLTDLKYIQLKEQKLKKKLEDIQRNEENQEKRWLSKEERTVLTVTEFALIPEDRSMTSEKSITLFLAA